MSGSGVGSSMRSSFSTPRLLNEPLYVNRMHCLNDDDNDEPFKTSASTLRTTTATTILPPSRFPTLCDDFETPRRNRPLSCPESWVEKEKRPPTPLDTSIDGKNRIAQEFIEKNYHRMQEYGHQYDKKTPRTLQKMIVEAKEFGPLINELRHKERARKFGTSSYQVKSCLDEHRAKPVYDIPSDPSIATLSTSRSQREMQISRLFAPTVALNASEKRYSRGFQHAPDYGNFSNFQGYLLQNQGTMLNR